MPIEFHIDHDRRVVFAKGVGVVAPAEMFDYQQQVWSRPEVAGYDELIDMSAVGKIHGAGADGVRRLAALSASMDADTAPSKLAIVAPDHLIFGMGRMYEAYRGLENRSTKEVAVFRTIQEGRAFLGLAEDAALDAPPMSK